MSTTTRPPFFYVDPDVGNCADLPLGAEFECVFAPEPTADDSRYIVRFRVTQYRQPWSSERPRGYALVSKTPISEHMADRLWQAREVRQPVMVAVAEGRAL